VHGRLRGDEKAAVMAAFVAGEIDVLVATTVIEVGVDVANASLMVIEHAERFGLAQLHQLRGRVGRGAHDSVCVLLYQQPLSATARARLKIIFEHSDGFEIARQDLRLRGPGEFVGSRQSGVPLLRYADLEVDADLVELAQEMAVQLLRDDPGARRTSSAALAGKSRGIAESLTTLTPEVLTNLAAGIFILPFFLFSATAGQFADKYDKAKLARLVKLLEIVIMGVALLGFSMHSLEVLLVPCSCSACIRRCSGRSSTRSCRSTCARDELVGGNALVEAGTFVAILIGTLAGGLLAGAAGHPTWVAFAGLVVAVVGYLCSRGIPAAAGAGSGSGRQPQPVLETWRNIGFARENRTVFLSILGISWFWLYGALFLAQFPAYSRRTFSAARDDSVTLLLAVFTSASASARCSASGSRPGTSKSVWCLSVRSA
jgi:hypothetical protein